MYDAETKKCIKTKTETKSPDVKAISPGVITQSISKISSNNCRLIDILNNSGFTVKNVEYFQKDSASDSMILKVTLEDKNQLIMKVSSSFGRKSLRDELFVELYMYKFLNSFKLPFRIQYIKDFNCKNEIDFIRQFQSFPQVKSKMINYFMNTSNNSTTNVLVSKMCNNCKTLYNMIVNGISKTAFYSIFVQLLFTLCYFQEIGFQHNDLHLNNIFIEQLSVNENLNIKFKKFNFNFETKYIVKIFDYDRANIVPTRYNFNTSFSNYINEEPTSRDLRCLSNKSNNGKRDSAQVIMALYFMIGDPTFKIIAEQFLPKDFRESTSDSYGLRMHYIAGKLSELAGKKYVYNDTIPCTPSSTGNKLEFYKDLQSPCDFMNKVLTFEQYTQILQVLPQPKSALKTTTSMLPSLAAECSEYTSLTHCVTPRTQLSSDKKKIFKQEFLRLAKEQASKNN
jgi:hypothetical protein